MAKRREQAGNKVIRGIVRDLELYPDAREATKLIARKWSVSYTFVQNIRRGSYSTVHRGRPIRTTQ